MDTTGSCSCHPTAARHGRSRWTVASNDLVLKDIQAKLAANPDSEELKALETEAQRNVEMGADKPFLDVWFENETTGFIVGAYNLVFATSDGGKTWQSWFDRVPNPQFMSLYSIRPAAGNVFIAGEQGTFFRLDREAMKFIAVPVDYVGSLFGVVDAGDAVLYFRHQGQGVSQRGRRCDLGRRGRQHATHDDRRRWRARSRCRGAGRPVGAHCHEQGWRQHIEPVQMPRTIPLTDIIDAVMADSG